MKPAEHPPTLPALDWPPAPTAPHPDSDKCECPRCGSIKTRRRSGRKIHTSRPRSGGQVQYRRCKACGHCFKAVFTWEYQVASVPT